MRNQKSNKPKKPKYILDIPVLPGEAIDGSGRTCIHLFVIDKAGSFVEPCVMQAELDENNVPIPGKIITPPTRGRIACNIKLIPNHKPDRNGIRAITLRTSDPRAVTCPKCKESEQYKQLITSMKE